jgi:membrane protease YdiL (CAAX protease family)
MWFSVAALATILSYTWFFEPRLPRAFAALAGAVVLALTAVHAFRTGEWGFAKGALVPALRATALATIPAVAALLLSGAARGTLHDRRATAWVLGSLLLWGGAQQWVLQTLVLREAQSATTRRVGVLVAALLFSAVHLPNLFLAAMTLAGALLWCALYDRHPNVLPLALSHALTTLAILYAFDGAFTGGLRIGAAYLRLVR